MAARAAAFAAMAIVVIFGGRITPLFTRNALRGRATVRERGRLDDAAVACALALVPLALWPEARAPTAIVAGLGAALNALRMRGWATRHTLDNPLLWVLHAGYAWAAVAMALWALAAARPDWILPSTALHAVTAGVLGTYTLGMMSRVTLGHTGRPLRAPRPMAAGYAAVLLAGAVRVAGPALAPGAAWPLHASGTLWTLAFVLFLVAYAPWLTAPRADGKPG